MQTEKIDKDNSGKLVLICLLGFFVTFASVDAFFVYKAVNTHSGVVTENAYEKGLAYDETLEKAREQQNMNLEALIRYSDQKLEFVLPNIDNANVKVHLVRPTHQGYDVEHQLKNNADDVYTAELNLPLNGLWRAQIEATWQDKTTKETMTLNKTQNFVYQK